MDNGDFHFKAYNSCGMQCFPGTYTNYGSITNNPLFVNPAGGDYRLANNSPCFNTGTNSSYTTNSANGGGSQDLDWRIRVRYGTVDMGAYERLNRGTIFGVH